MDTSISTDSRYASLTWRLLDFGGREARLQAADHLLSAALASRDAIVQKIMRDVIALYFSAQSAQAEREARTEGKNIAQEILAMTKRRELQGLAAHTDSLQAATALAKAELELARATANADKTSLALALQLGLPQYRMQIPRIQAADVSRYQLIQKDLNTWQALASAQHPAIVAAYAQWQAAKEQYKATRADGLPVLDFSHSRYLNGRPNQELSARQSRESVTGLTLSIPLFEGFGRHYNNKGHWHRLPRKKRNGRKPVTRYCMTSVRLIAKPRPPCSPWKPRADCCVLQRKPCRPSSANTPWVWLTHRKFSMRKQVWPMHDKSGYGPGRMALGTVTLIG
jgi:outer membrane protein